MVAHIWGNCSRQAAVAAAAATAAAAAAVQGIDYLCKRIGVKQSQMELESHRILATAACSLVRAALLGLVSVNVWVFGASRFG
jgi:hypothetical protein